jgi:iron complex outermembrane receptor protein
MAYRSIRKAECFGKLAPRRVLPLSLVTALNTKTVIAAEQNIAFDIPAQSLSGALNSFAGIARTQQSYPPALTESLKSPGFKGQFTTQQALQRLLSGTDLVSSATANGTISLHKAPDSPNEVSSLSAVTVSGTRAGSNAADPYSKDYAVTKPFAATKTDTPIMENPTSMQVVSRAVMDNQKTTRINYALENVSGARANPNLGGGTGFIIRGSRITAQLNIRNILNKDYYESADPDSNVAPGLGVHPGAPLTAIGTIRLEY